MKIKERNDIFRDDRTSAIVYEIDKEISARNDVKKMKTEIHNLKSTVEEIKTLLERLIDGR